MQGNLRVRVAHVYYTWHPDFEDHGDGSYETLKTGRWIVEWDAKLNSDRWHFKHCAAECATEKMAQKLTYILNKKHEKEQPWTSVPADDICLSSGKFERINGKYVITAPSDGQKPESPILS